MTEKEARQKIKEISRQLMHLANANNGNARAFDAILAADVALCEYLES